MAGVISGKMSLGRIGICVREAKYEIRAEALERRSAMSGWLLGDSVVKERDTADNYEGSVVMPGKTSK